MDFVLKISSNKFDQQDALNEFFPSWYHIMRFEEVVVFTCGLMKDPIALICHICKKFNIMNTRYLGLYNRVPDEAKEMKLKHMGKTAVNLDFFRLVWAESGSQLPWLPLQNPHFNWFDHERDDQHRVARDRSCVHIPSEYYSFQNLKEPISSHNIQEHEQFGQCSIVIDNPHPDVVDSLLSTCSTICKHQAVANLCLFNLHIKNTAIDNIFKLSPNAEFLVIEDCILPSIMMSCLFQQISVCSTLKGIRLHNSTFEESEKSLIHLSEAIQKWGDNNGLKYLVIRNSSLLPDQCSSLLQSLSKCKHLTYLCLSDNVVGSAGKQLAESIRNWGINPPLERLYLANCGLHEDDCAELLQSLLGCVNLDEINLSGNTIGKAVKHLVEAIHKLSSYGKLEELYLSDCSFPEDQCAAILKSLSLCKQLTCLDLSNNRIRNAGKDLADSIKQWGVNPPLQVLDLGNCGLNEDDCAELLQSLLACGNLEEINLSGNAIGKASTYLIEIIRNSRHLQKLYLKKSSIPEQYWSEIFNSLGTCNNLTRIDLAFNTVGESASQLAQSIRQWGDNPPLQQLHLRNCSIPKQYWSEIFNSLGTCNNLTRIDFSNNTVGESASQLAQSVRQWGDNPPLQVLDLYGCSIPEDACCELISALFSCTRLTELYLAGSHLCENGLHLKRYLETITDTLEVILMDVCSMPVDVCGQIISILSSCKNLEHMAVFGNTLTGQFSQFMPHPPLRTLYLGDTALNKDDLNHLTNLFKSSKLANLSELLLVQNSIDTMEDDFGKLLDTCIKHHKQQLDISLCRNNLSESFMETWSNKCKETGITLDFHTDIDEYNDNL